MIPYQKSKDLHESVACVEYSIPNDTIQKVFQNDKCQFEMCFQSDSFCLEHTVCYFKS